MKIDLGNLEYVALRFIRKYFLTYAVLLKIGKYLPYYLTNTNQQDPFIVLDQYEKVLKKYQFDFNNINILEIGTGATNSMGYSITSRYQTSYIGYEPFVHLDQKTDSILLDKIAEGDEKKKEHLSKCVKRIKTLSSVDEGTIDLVLSHSVIEHIPASDLVVFTQELWKVMRPGGLMVHVMDYRDHFFKYPFHFYQFSKQTWDRYLNPGDLHRLRLSQHIKILENNFSVVEIIVSERNEKAFNKIKNYIHKDFSEFSDQDLAVSSAVIILRK